MLDAASRAQSICKHVVTSGPSILSLQLGSESQEPGDDLLGVSGPDRWPQVPGADRTVHQLPLSLCQPTLGLNPDSFEPTSGLCRFLSRSLVQIPHKQHLGTFFIF